MFFGGAVFVHFPKTLPGDLLSVPSIEKVAGAAARGGSLKFRVQKSNDFTEPKCQTLIYSKKIQNAAKLRKKLLLL